MRAAGDSRPLFRKGVLCVHEPRDVVTVDDFIHVIDGKLVCYESNQFDWENPEDKKQLLDFVEILYETEELAAMGLLTYGDTNAYVSVSVPVKDLLEGQQPM